MKKTGNEEAFFYFLKRKKAVGFISAALVCIFTICILITYINGRSSQDLYVGESVGATKILDCSGDRMLLKDINSNRIVVFYVDKKCSRCVNEIPSLNVLCKLLKTTDFKPVVIWRKDYPGEYVEKGNEMFFYRTVSGELSSFTPCYFVIEDGIVVFRTDRLDKLIEKLLYSGDEEQLRVNALTNFSEEFNMENQDYYLVFCDDKTDISSIEDIFRDKLMITISNYSEETMVYDPENVLAEIFDITNYPTVVSISKNNEMLIIEQ